MPSQPPSTNAPSAKRKVPDGADVFAQLPKKQKVNTAGESGPKKRKRPEEEQFGGLLITRGPPSRSTSVLDSTSSTSRSGTSTSKPSSSQQSSKPLSSKFASTSAVSLTRRNEKEHEQDVEEEVKQMNSEADDLRDRSRASMANLSPAARKIDFSFPSTSISAENSRIQKNKFVLERDSNFGTLPQQTGSQDVEMPLAEHETPQIMKNRQMRDGRPPSQLVQTSSSTSAVGSSLPVRRVPGANLRPNEESSRHARKSSLSMRGKRTSAMFQTGIVARPHNSVSNDTLYKHIDPDMPESQRVRQLITWAALRAIDSTSSNSTASSSKPRKHNSNKKPPDPLPPLPLGGEMILKAIQDDIIKQLADKQIDTSAYGGPSEVNNAGAWTLKQNVQNLKNLAREKLFTEQIEERKKEDAAWTEVGHFYETYVSNVLSSLEQRRRSMSSMSAKAKGKQRATSEDPDSEPWENELPAKFRGANGYDIAKRIIHERDRIGKGDARLEDLEYKEDQLHTIFSAIERFILTVASELDHRFSIMSLSLAQRAIPSGHPPSSSSTLSNFIPFTSLPKSQTTRTDPRELLRAISYIDAERPRSQLGEAVRRATNDVRRLDESQAGQSDVTMRKLTDVPPTPRKAPGTPKRPTTPSAGR